MKKSILCINFRYYSTLDRLALNNYLIKLIIYFNLNHPLFY